MRGRVEYLRGRVEYLRGRVEYLRGRGGTAASTCGYWRGIVNGGWGGGFDVVAEGAEGLGEGGGVGGVEGDAVGGDDFAEAVADEFVAAQLGEAVRGVGFEDEEGTQAQLLAGEGPSV